MPGRFDVQAFGLVSESDMTEMWVMVLGGLIRSLICATLPGGRPSSSLNMRMKWLVDWKPTLRDVLYGQFGGAEQQPLGIFDAQAGDPFAERGVVCGVDVARKVCTVCEQVVATSVIVSPGRVYPSAAIHSSSRAAMSARMLVGMAAAGSGVSSAAAGSVRVSASSARSTCS